MVCLPALVEGAKEHLKLPDSIVGLVMPLAVSMFKVNKAVSAPLKMYFLAHIYGITLDPTAVLFFFIAYIPLSFSSPGIPSGGFFVSLPLYIALGIPVEGVVLLRTVDAIPDIFKTVSNVTEDMSVAALVTKFSGLGANAQGEVPYLSSDT
jgi:Na+/H+-dicarboxylate symporter